MTYRWLIALLMLLWLPFPSQAFDLHQGPYLQVSAGYHIPDVAEGENFQGTFNLEFDGGVQGAVAAGYDFDPKDNLGDGRVELEWAYRRVSLDKVEFAEGDVPGDGDLVVQSLLFNVFGIYRNGTPWVPYFGGGFGVAQVTAEDLRASGQPFVDGDDITFAYQLGAGISYAMTEQFACDLGYRFFGLASPRLDLADGRGIDLEYHGHTALLGLRWGF